MSKRSPKLKQKRKRKHGKKRHGEITWKLSGPAVAAEFCNCCNLRRSGGDRRRGSGWKGEGGDDYATIPSPRGRRGEEGKRWKSVDASTLNRDIRGVWQMEIREAHWWHSVVRKFCARLFAASSPTWVIPMNRSPPFAAARVCLYRPCVVSCVYSCAPFVAFFLLSLSLPSTCPSSPLRRFVDDHTRRVFSPLNAWSRSFSLSFFLVSITFQRERERFSKRVENIDRTRRLIIVRDDNNNNSKRCFDIFLPFLLFERQHLVIERYFRRVVLSLVEDAFSSFLSNLFESWKEKGTIYER